MRFFCFGHVSQSCLRVSRQRDDSDEDRFWMNIDASGMRLAIDSDFSRSCRAIIDRKPGSIAFHFHCSEFCASAGQWLSDVYLWHTFTDKKRFNFCDIESLVRSTFAPDLGWVQTYSSGSERIYSRGIYKLSISKNLPSVVTVPKDTLLIALGWSDSNGKANYVCFLRSDSLDWSVICSDAAKVVSRLMFLDEYGLPECVQRFINFMQPSRVSSHVLAGVALRQEHRGIA